MASEFFWIYSVGRGPDGPGAPWGGLRVGAFQKTHDGTEIVVIQGEVDQRRIGVRIWDDVAEREGWVKVAPIPIPTAEQIKAALDARLFDIAKQITDDVMKGKPDDHGSR